MPKSMEEYLALADIVPNITKSLTGLAQTYYGGKMAPKIAAQPNARAGLMTFQNEMPFPGAATTEQPEIQNALLSAQGNEEQAGIDQTTKLNYDMMVSAYDSLPDGAKKRTLDPRVYSGMTLTDSQKKTWVEQMENAVVTYEKEQLFKGESGMISSMRVATKDKPEAAAWAEVDGRVPLEDRAYLHKILEDKEWAPWRPSSSSGVATEKESRLRNLETQLVNMRTRLRKTFTQDNVNLYNNLVEQGLELSKQIGRPWEYEKIVPKDSWWTKFKKKTFGTSSKKPDEFDTLFGTR